ncbi:MAG: hypothetical protein BWY57_01230 [Betaproteobacteria bacterium ADurb.Bin341]|nr:MAG: hypothetical protein BWY57_01230 [Betaproteobacteria bacterium ADurb.Bin341]
MLIVLGVLQDLLVLGRFQPGLEPCERLLARQLFYNAGSAVRQRDITGLAHRHAQRKTNNAGAKGIEAGGFGIERGQFGGFDLGQPGLETIPIEDGFVVRGDD